MSRRGGGYRGGGGSRGGGGRGGGSRGGGGGYRGKNNYRGKNYDDDDYYSGYAPKEQSNKGPVDLGSFPTLGASDAFPSLGNDPEFPGLEAALKASIATSTATTTTTTANPDSEWGYNIKKKIQPAPVVQEPAPTQSSNTQKGSQKYNTKAADYWPEVGGSDRPQSAYQKEEPQIYQPKKVEKEPLPAKKTDKEVPTKKYEEKKKEPEKEAVIQKKEHQEHKAHSSGRRTNDKDMSLFNQMKENLSTRSNTTTEEIKTGDQDELYDYYQDNEKYMIEKVDDDYYDYEGDAGVEDWGYEDAEAELDKYLTQNPRDRGGGGLVLMVAEKPSIARSITEALSHGNSKMRKGRSKFCPVYEFSGSIFGKSAYFRVTSVAGHVFTTDFPPQYRDWQKTDPLKLFEVAPVKKESDPKSRMVQHLQAEARNASYLVLWLDNDKEGENICFEVLDSVKEYMRKESFMQVYRAKFSSIVKQDLQEAFKKINMGPNYNESISVDARQIIDLKVGVAFSRFQTIYFTAKYPNLNTKLVSYGPCQTPTLGFCVKRDQEIQDFKPKTFYRVIPTIVTPNGKSCEANWSGDRTFSHQEALKIKADLDKNKEAVVTYVSEKEGSKPRPEALNTVQLLRVASAQLGIGPQQAMHIAERLYLSGYLTYPRTESTSYPGKYDFRGLTSSLTSLFGEHSRKLLQGEMRNPKGGKDVGDHPPITPTNKVPSRESLMNDEWRVYEYVARHFLATISPDAKLMKRSVTFQASQYEFTLSGSSTISPGFTEIMPWIKLNDNFIPEFKLNQVCLISIVEVRTGQTTAPDHLTESELITLMEKHGIGTDASMATHINNICERNYVKVTGTSRKLMPTDLGASLVRGYELIDPDLVAPTLRANIEKSVEMIAKGEAKYDQVLKEMIAIFTQKFLYFKENISKMDVIFGGSFGTVEENISKGRPFSKCGKCNRLLKFADRYNKLHCENCNLTLDLPANGSIKLAGDRKCPLDNYGLVIFAAAGAQAARYYICPYCYNNSPFPEISANLSCNQCIQEDCPYSVPHHEIKDCDICKEGQFIIDQLAGTKATATCNVCSAEILIAENVATVVRDNKECNSCGAYLFKSITLKSSAQGLSEQKYEGICIFCHKEFAQITKSKLPPNPYRGRGRRGGRRRGRRGGRKRYERDWRDI